MPTVNELHPVPPDECEEIPAGELELEMPDEPGTSAPPSTFPPEVAP